MRRGLVGLLAAAIISGGFIGYRALSTSSDVRPTVHRMRSQHGARARSAPHSSGSAAPAAYALCDQLQAGDKVGNWGCVNGDTTTAAGSSLTFSNVGTPTVTSGTTCASPSKAAFTSSARVKSNGTTFPTGAYSICGYFDMTSVSAPYAMWSFGNSSNGYAMSQETATTVWVQYDSTVHSLGTSGPSASLTFVCLTSSALLSVNAYFNGTQQGPTPTFVYIDPGSSSWVFGSDSLGSGYRFTGPFLGGFITEKELTAADVLRISNAVRCM